VRLTRGRSGRFIALAAGWLLSCAVVARAAEGVPHTASTQFNIAYDIADDQAKAELWASENGGATWTRVGFDPDNVSPIGFIADHDATYGFFVVVEDIAGNRSPEPAGETTPQLTVVVDTRRPEVKLLHPNGGVFGPSRGIDVVWRAADEYLAAHPVTIEVSRDGGTTWTEVASRLPGEGTLPWRLKGLPPEGVAEYRFRVRAVDLAGNIGEAVSAGGCLLDERPPSVRAVGPSSASGVEVPVRIEGDDAAGGTGLESVRIYVSADNGATWQEAASSDVPSDPIVWRAPRAGRFGLYAAATDKGGNVQLAPAPATKPQLYTTVTAVGPIVVLQNMNSGGYYRGGAIQAVAWEVSGTGVTDRSVALEYSVDGGATWVAIARDLPASGQFDWTVPKVDTASAAVRVRAVTDDGQTGSDESDRFFVIDSTPPRSVARFEPAGQVSVAAGTVATPPKVAAPPAPLRPIPGTPAHRPATPPPPVELLKATKHMAAGEHDEAIALLSGLVAREPANVKAHLALGESVARRTDALARHGGLSPAELLRRYDEAAASFRSAVKLDAGSNDARVWLGLCQFQRGSIFHRELRRPDAASREWEAATTEFEKALALPPNGSDEYSFAGTAYYMLTVAGPQDKQRTFADRAEELLRRALAGGAGATAASAHWYLAELAEKRADTARALEHWRSALELFRDNAVRAKEIRGRIAALGGR
jgi:hypothetical protein